MATQAHDKVVFTSAALTADGQVLTVTSAGDRLICLFVTFNQVATPKYPFSFNLHDGTDNTGSLLFSFRGADQAPSATLGLPLDNVASGPWLIYGGNLVDGSEKGGGFPLQTGLYCDLTQGGSGTNAVSVTFTGMVGRKV